MTVKEKAQATLGTAAHAARSLAECYRRTFSTADGKRVLADLRALFPHDRPRFDAASAFRQPVAALMGGIHFDGSASVIKRILDQIEDATKPPQPTPTIETA